MKEQSTEAVVLRSYEYNESDKLVRFATRDFGKVSGIAKGAKRSRRRFPNALETFSHIRLLFRSNRKGGLALILGCDLIESRARIGTDLSALALASFFAEIVDLTLHEGQETKRVFSLLDWALRWLNLKGPSLQILPFFVLHWLKASGLEPELHHCLKCKSQAAFDEPVFSVERGGVLCPSCSFDLKKAPRQNGQELFLPLRPGTMRGLAALASARLEDFTRIELSRDQIREGHNILKSFLRFYIGCEFKSVRFLDQTLSLQMP